MRASSYVWSGIGVLYTICFCFVNTISADIMLSLYIYMFILPRSNFAAIYCSVPYEVAVVTAASGVCMAVYSCVIACVCWFSRGVFLLVYVRE